MIRIAKPENFENTTTATKLLVINISDSNNFIVAKDCELVLHAKQQWKKSVRNLDLNIYYVKMDNTFLIELFKESVKELILNLLFSIVFFMVTGLLWGFLINKEILVENLSKTAW